MSNDTFDFLRFLAEIGISAIGAFYEGLAEIWNLPYGKAVMATSLLLSTLLGVFTDYQRKKHNKQKMYEGIEE